MIFTLLSKWGIKRVKARPTAGKGFGFIKKAVHICSCT